MPSLPSSRKTLSPPIVGPGNVVCIDLDHGLYRIPATDSPPKGVRGRNWAWTAMQPPPHGRPEEFHLQPPTEPPLDLHGSPFPCPLAMTVDAESDCSARSLGWRPPSLSIRFAPRSLQVLRRYYRMIRPRHAHLYFPPSCFALVRFSLRMA